MRLKKIIISKKSLFEILKYLEAGDLEGCRFAGNDNDNIYILITNSEYPDSQEVSEYKCYLTPERFQILKKFIQSAENIYKQMEKENYNKIMNESIN